MLEFDCKTIYNYFNRWYLKLNTTKTVTNFFHLNNHEADNTLNIKINDSKLPSNKTPKYLGVYLDRTLTYRKHLEESTNKLKKRNFLIKKLTETTWGASPSVLKICALALCYSVAEYCPLSGVTAHTPKIDTQLRQAMRIITGTLKYFPLSWLPMLSYIAPPHLRRELANQRQHNRLDSNEIEISLKQIMKEALTTTRLKSR